MAQLLSIQAPAGPLLAGSTGSAYWFASRGAGSVTLLLLSATVVLGMAQTVRFRSLVWPRYLTIGLHRDLSLLTLAFLVIHVVASVLDPFARLGIKDALVPFASWYRPLWLGLGVVGAELSLALTVTSLVRRWLSFRLWRTLHWLAYLCWPVALLHGLGTGSDVRRYWFLGLEAAAVLAFFLFLVFWRLSFGWPRLAWPRLAAAALSGLALVALALWVLNGPMAPGWARAAGTPDALLGGGASNPTPTP
jgi:sulfoxide reductase heme-binding subunit YedZ